MADDGALYAWGMQDYTVSITGTAYPVRVEGVPAMKATEGDYAIDTGGQVWFLDGGKAKPRKLEGLDRVKSMRQSGENSLIALKEDGSVWTWRHVYQYQEGKGEQWEDTLNSVQTANAKDVFAGMQLGYVLQPDGTLAIVPFEPKLPRESKSSIVKLSGSSKIVRAEAATDYSSVFLLADNGEWHRYDENTGSIELLEGLQSALKITGGELFTLALMKDGTVRGWGSRQELLQPEGMKAEDVMDDSAPSLPQWKITPAMSIRIQGLSDIADIQAGSDHALALRKDGTVLSWGSNSTGQLGRMLNGASQPIQVGMLKNGATPLLLGWEGPYLLRDGDVYRLDNDGHAVPWVIGQKVIKASYAPEGPLFLTAAGQLIETHYRGAGCRLVKASLPIRDMNEDGNRNVLVLLDSGSIVRLTWDGQTVKAQELQLPGAAKPSRLFGYPFPIVLAQDGAVYAAKTMLMTGTELIRIPDLPKIVTWSSRAPAYYDGGTFGFGLDENGTVYEAIALMLNNGQLQPTAPTRFDVKPVQRGIASLYGSLTIGKDGRLFEQDYRYKIDWVYPAAADIRTMLSTYNYNIEGPGHMSHAAVTKDGRLLWLGDMPFQRLGNPPAPVTFAP